jgi:hypothetical protein
MTPLGCVELLGPDGQRVVLRRDVDTVRVHVSGPEGVPGQATTVVMFRPTPLHDDRQNRALVRRLVVPLLILPDESVHSTLFSDVEDEVMKYVSGLLWPV